MSNLFERRAVLARVERVLRDHLRHLEIPVVDSAHGDTMIIGDIGAMSLTRLAEAVVEAVSEGRE